jgi:tRNA C32,U32 (ribose-2'-O)-methylase TrmJ
MMKKEVLSPLMAVEEREEDESSEIAINEGNERVGLTSEEAERVRNHRDSHYKSYRIALTLYLLLLF